MKRPNHWTSTLRSSLRLLACSYATVAALIGTARADDSEIYISQSTAAPNIMLILDTSGSMDGQVTTQDAYVPGRDYIGEASGDCASIRDRVYFKTRSQGTPPSCSSSDWVSTTNLRCAAADTGLASTAGSYQGDRFVHWRRYSTDSTSTVRSWRALQGGFNTPVDCKNDPSPYPQASGSSTSDTPAYTSTSNDSYWTVTPDGGSSATLYSANFVAYYAQFRNAVTSTRLKVMQQAATNLLNAVSNVNVGLMRYSSNTSNENGGGMVLEPVAPIADNRAELIREINAFVADGNTPLSETLYEAHQYFKGDSVVFGNTSRGCYRNSSGTEVCSSIPSVAASRTGGVLTSNTYASPATQSCQKNYVVYLTDGEPTSDSQANNSIQNLADFSTLVTRGCDGDANGDGTVDTQGNCLGALSEYMFKKDLRSSLMGEQNVTSYYIGFGSAFGTGTSNAAFDYLVDAGVRGGGNAYQAGDLSDLTQVFSNIFNTISSNSSTLTAPTVAVNAFNRTRTLDDLYISVFQPSAGIRWPGNVKKYRVYGEDTAPDIRARGNVPAIGANGAFLDSISDYWSETNGDGARVALGGSARQIPTPLNRNLYTYIGNNPGLGGAPLANTAGAVVSVDNDLITAELLGIDASAPTRDTLLKWVRGADVDDTDDDDDRDEPRFAMGDPMHSQPAVLIYGGRPTDRDEDDAVVFTATNDGYVHAFATEDGEELWSFIPQELLPTLKPLYQNENSARKNYAIDGDLRVLKYDTNGDGIVDPSDNDRVLLFFSTGRNPTLSRYYALDVTAKNSPKFLWSIGPDQLSGLGQAWSRPTISRVNIRGATQNTQKLVLIFGGGYDPTEEASAFVEANGVGNRIFMVDAVRGTPLWSAGIDAADLELERMTHSIPAAVNVIDLDGDSFADRMYVGDMAAQLWRFDIYNGNVKEQLVTGGVIASLGAKDADAVNAANTRRFYNSPDAALLQPDTTVVQATSSRPFLNIAIGSGYRGHPLSTSNQDRFYSIRDYRPYAKLTQTQYGELDIVTDDELDDITTDLAPRLTSNSRGWKLQLNDPTYRGEKILSSSTTLQNTVFFTSYTPSASESSNTCSVAVGSNRGYAISAFDGRPVAPRSSSTGPSNPTDPNNPTNPPPPRREDRYRDLGQTGIAPEVTVLFPEDDQITCLSGVEVLNVCKDFNSRIKTYWRQTNAN